MALQKGGDSAGRILAAPWLSPFIEVLVLPGGVGLVVELVQQPSVPNGSHGLHTVSQHLRKFLEGRKPTERSVGIGGDGGRIGLLGHGNPAWDGQLDLGACC
jgi:hypothetical protein